MAVKKSASTKGHTQNLKEQYKPFLDGLQPNTQNYRLLKYLTEHGSATPIDAWFDLAIYRTASRIHDLRSMGVNIRTLRIEKTDPDNGETIRYAKYVLVGKEEA